MSINEVKELRGTGPSFFSTDILFSPISLIFLITTIVFIIGLLLKKRIKSNSILTKKELLVSSIIGLIFAVIFSTITFDVSTNDWAENIVVPYIESLPSQNAERVVKFTEKRSSVNNSIYFNYLLTSNGKVEDSVYGELTYIENDKEKVERGWFILLLGESDKATYSYKMVSEELSEDIPKGSYNKEIRLPESYFKEQNSSIYYLE